MAPVRGRRLIDRVIARVYAAAQAARSQEDYQLGTITLRLLGQVRRDGVGNLDAASREAFGFSFARFSQRNLERQSMMAWELSRCVPDFDPQEAAHARMVQASQERGSETRSGRMYPMPEQARPTIKEPLPKVSRKATAG